MKATAGLLVLPLALVAGCNEHFHTLWHGETLPSGAMIKVTSFNLVWAIGHDDRDVRKDAFALEYVSAHPGGEVARREAEATQVFELVRPLSELRGCRTASLAAFPTLERRGRYDLYRFERAADGRWSFERTEAKVFATD